jgi:hypothetical protein
VKEILTLISLLSCSCIYSQETIDSLQIENPLLNIGKKITKENNFETTKYDYRGYQYLPAQRDSILFDGVAFGKVIATVNKRGKIENLSFRRFYSGVDSIYLNEILNKDFEIIANWISKKYLCDKYGPILQYGDPRVWNEATRWMVKKRKVRLIKSFDQIRSDNKLFNSLEFKIY